MPPYDEYGSDWDPTSPNVARAVARYGAGELGPQRGPAPWMNRHDDPDLMTRVMRSLFGQPKQQGITSQPLPPPAGSQAMDPTFPFGGPAPAGTIWQQPPEPKPASRISSNQAIIERINRMMSGNSPRAQQDPPPVTSADFMPAPAPTAGVRNAPMQYYARTLQPDSVPYELLNSGPLPEHLNRAAPVDLRGPDLAVPELSWLRKIFGGPAAAQSQSGSPFGRADGGPIPGFMRGGYPDLYGVDERGVEPMRTFDSGGENYVGNDYSEAPGRADDVNAKLSAREYVIDAETMALLGDGNPDAGAKKMDEFRQNVRKHKGKALAKGKISPDAKPAASSYIAGNPMGDGLRRRGREKA